MNEYKNEKIDYCTDCKYKKIGGEEACKYCYHRIRDVVKVKDYRLSELKKICKENREKYKETDNPCGVCPIGDFCDVHLYDDFPMSWEIEEI